VYHHLPIEAGNMKWNQEAPSHFSVLEFTGDREVWHGTPVLRTSDSRLIGILLIDELGTKILPISDSFHAGNANGSR